MTFKPRLPFKELNQYLIKEFEDAAKDLPEDLEIHKTIKFYKDLHDE